MSVDASGPWAFGWSQLLTIIGFILTGVIALGGFRTFDRWKREKLEERRIDVALEALALAYEVKDVFAEIRNRGSFPYEWEDMPVIEGESEKNRERRGTYYAVGKRIRAYRDFFTKVWQLQPRFMAVFGPDNGKLFSLIHEARAEISVAVNMAMSLGEIRDQTQISLHYSIWGPMQDGAFDPVTSKLNVFEKGIEDICRPIIDRQFKRQWY